MTEEQRKKDELKLLRTRIKSLLRGDFPDKFAYMLEEDQLETQALFRYPIDYILKDGIKVPFASEKEKLLVFDELTKSQWLRPSTFTMINDGYTYNGSGRPFMWHLTVQAAAQKLKVVEWTTLHGTIPEDEWASRNFEVKNLLTNRLEGKDSELTPKGDIKPRMNPLYLWGPVSKVGDTNNFFDAEKFLTLRETHNRILTASLSEAGLEDFFSETSLDPRDIAFFIQMKPQPKTLLPHQIAAKEKAEANQPSKRKSVEL